MRPALCVLSLGSALGCRAASATPANAAANVYTWRGSGSVAPSFGSSIDTGCATSIGVSPTLPLPPPTLH